LVEIVTFDATWVIIISIIALSVVVLGLFWGNLKRNDVSFYKDKENDLKNQIKYYRDEVHRLNGTIGKQRSQFQVDGDYNLNDKGDLASLAKSILPEILGFLPKNVQESAKGLLNKPELVDLLETAYKLFPKEVSQMLGGFLKGGGKLMSQENNILTQKSTWKDGAA